MLSQEWARSLVGRDWEIFWNDSEENEDKTDEKKQDAMNQVQVDESHAIDEKKPDVMKVTDEKHDEKNQDAMNQVQVDESHAVDEKKPDAMKVTDEKHDEQNQDEMNQVKMDESHTFAEKKPDEVEVTDEKHDEKKQDEMNQVKMDESHAIDEKKPDEMKVTDEKHDEMKQDEMNQVKMDDSHAVDEKKQDDMEVDKDDDDDDNSEGSVIDDWYAGNVLSLESQDGDKFSFKVRFVGDETIYDMVLDPSKIRPSASGWIKRTTAILGCKTWETRLPPDTRTTEDNESLTNLQNELNAKKYLNFTPPEQKEGAEVPIIEDLQKILSLRYLLQAQIYLRSRLPTIVNHHGSTQYVDGEPNPRESYVDHLAQCCKDLDQVCAWYCRCWELLTTFFGETANSSSSKDTKRIIFEEVFEKYLEFGKDSIVSCATMDISPTASKRRLLPPPTSPQRRPKRRRKNARWGGSHASDLQNVANGEDLKSTAYVDGFVRTLKESTDRAYLPTCGRILQALSHFVVEPVENWKRQAGYLLGEQGEDEAGADDDDRDKSDSEEGDDDSNEDKESEYFMYEEIESCVAAIKSDRVLSLVDLTKEDDRLRKKLANIDSISMEATVLLSRTTEDTGVQSQGHDEVLAGLKRILKATQSPDHSVFNVEPIGRSGSKMTRDLLMGVIQTRALLIDVKHMELTRERSVFIQELSSRINQLAPLVHAPQIVNIVAIAKKLGEANMKITKMMDCLSNHIPLFRTILTEIEHRQNETNSLMSKDSAMEALKELGNCSVISLVEEKISIRVDVLDWNQEAKPTLETNGTNIGYAQLGRLHNLLQLILSGRSLTRMQILKDVQQNDMVESELKSFAFTDAKSICGPLVERVTSLFSKASKWKERAESTISTLQLHGNAAVGMALASPKPPAMVAFSRIHDLVEEYKSLQVEVPGYTATLQKAEEDAKNWSSKLHSTIIDSGISLERCHVFLEKERDLRPRGIIMDPTRHVFDSLLDALVWHKRVKDGMRLAIDELKALIQNDPSTLTAEKYSMLLTDRMYPLLVEGTDAVEVFAESRAVSGQFKAKSQHSVELLEELFHIRRSARALSREKLESHPLGSSILSRMVHADYDRTEGFPLLLMLWAQWHFFVAKFVSKFPDESSDDESEGDNPKSANTGSLAEAKELRAQQPLLDDCDSGISPEIVFLLKTDTTERLLLDRVIQEGGQIETEARELLLRSREMLRGGINKPDLVRQHLAELKESLATFKNRSAGVGGLLLSTVIERQVEHHIKIFAWMVRTLPYRLLYLDEASYSEIGSDDNNGDENTRIPWDVLVGLYDRIPCEVEERAGDFALVSLRVRELYEAGKKWQDEITRTTMLSFRGGKRRAPTGPGAFSPVKPEKEQEASSQLRMEQMKKLAEHPILAKVVMPRERAVSGMLKNSHEFEIQLFNFLGKDYDGLSPDRVALPDSESLMGKKGEFILYRLTCGPLFDSLQSSMHPLSIVGENLLAETPGKATFEWIRSAVSWIERLNDSLTTESPFEDNAGKILAIPGAEARDILKEGENFFLRIPEDLKKTLSNHGIFVSTNKQERTLRVIVKKDGAHHSVGGTVIRWCPILFDSLRADVNKFETWEKELMRVLAQFNSFFAGTRDHQKDDQEDLYMWYCFREQIEEILKEGKALIVSPQKSLAQSFQKMLESMKKYLEQHSKPEWDRAFAKKWFAQSTSLLDDRFHLLESLLHRNNISSKKPAEETRDLSPAHQPDRTFRDACRSYIEKSLKKALKTVGMVATTESNDESKEIESFCGIKAWEVETEMFEKFQDEFGLSRVSEEYRNKARNLRASLEDRNNASLCLRVLIGEIGVAKLVDMSSEELASHKAKLERARAEQKAKSFALLTPEVKDKKPDDTKEPNVQEIPESKVAGLVSSTATGGNDTNGVASAMTTETKKVDEVEAYDSSSPPPSPFLSLARSSNSASPTLPKELLSKSSRPPPPPSLAISLSQSSASETTNAAAKSADRGKRVETSSGGDKFRIEIGNPKVSFHAAFFLEDESQAGVSHFLPPVLTERGRLKIHEFSRFLSDKLSRGYLAIPLRLTTLSDQDAKEYRTFYKEYEMKERIAMFSVNGQNSKVFLVPPKFHGAAKKTGLVSLPNKTRTYAIVLTKEIGVLMN